MPNAIASEADAARFTMTATSTVAGINRHGPAPRPLGGDIRERAGIPAVSLSATIELSLSLSFTHTHTHTHYLSFSLSCTNPTDKCRSQPRSCSRSESKRHRECIRASRPTRIRRMHEHRAVRPPRS